MALPRDIRTLIVEDEAAARELLTTHVVQRTELKLVGLAKDGPSAVDILNSTPVDLVFLDIDLPGMTGFQVLEQTGKDPYVIFTTGSRDSAIAAFDIGAVDYLVKPIPKERFGRAVDRALLFFRSESAAKHAPRRHGLFVTEKENHYLVPFSEIIYVASHENYCSIHTAARDYATYSSLKLMEERLPAGEFIRIYKQYIVNIAMIQRIQSDMAGNYSVFLKDDDETELPVGRAYAQRVKELIR